MQFRPIYILQYLRNMKGIMGDLPEICVHAYLKGQAANAKWYICLHTYKYIHIYIIEACFLMQKYYRGERVFYLPAMTLNCTPDFDGVSFVSLRAGRPGSSHDFYNRSFNAHSRPPRYFLMLQHLYNRPTPSSHP